MAEDILRLGLVGRPRLRLKRGRASRTATVGRRPVRPASADTSCTSTDSSQRMFMRIVMVSL